MKPFLMNRLEATAKTLFAKGWKKFLPLLFTLRDAMATTPDKMAITSVVAAGNRFALSIVAESSALAEAEENQKRKDELAQAQAELASLQAEVDAAAADAATEKGEADSANAEFEAAKAAAEAAGLSVENAEDVLSAAKKKDKEAAESVLAEAKKAAKEAARNVADKKAAAAGKAITAAKKESALEKFKKKLDKQMAGK